MVCNYGEQTETRKGEIGRASETFQRQTQAIATTRKRV